ncbi:MAG: sporulation protein YabP [Lachnospiraceae bacterium]|nr:sporulation protein YabP [Lachnospiraceae bacterium]
MEDINTGKQRVHKFMLTNRRTCMVNGVSDVLSFDLTEILLETDLGMLMIRGSDLHVNRLTLEKGEVDIEGKIDSLTYSEVNSYGNKAESLFGKLFK